MCWNCCLCMCSCSSDEQAIRSNEIDRQLALEATARRAPDYKRTEDKNWVKRKLSGEKSHFMHCSTVGPGVLLRPPSQGLDPSFGTENIMLGDELGDELGGGQYTLALPASPNIAPDNFKQSGVIKTLWGPEFKFAYCFTLNTGATYYSANDCSGSKPSEVGIKEIIPCSAIVRVYKLDERTKTYSAHPKYPNGLRPTSEYSEGRSSSLSLSSSSSV